MLGFEFFEKLPCRPHRPLFQVVEPLTDTFLSTGAGGDMEKMLTGGGVLNHCGSLPFDRE
jgi:hypothetical protein